jgi:hypothetical protein
LCWVPIAGRNADFAMMLRTKLRGGRDRCLAKAVSSTKDAGDRMRLQKTVTA